MSYFRHGAAISTKQDGSIVTEADHAVERLLQEQFAELRPDDCVLGEEFGAVGRGTRRWIVDPIDGTAFFARDDPNWRVHIALSVEGRIDLAVVAAPALGLRWWATRGDGAFEATWHDDGPAGARRLAVSATDRVAGAVVDAYPHELIERFPSETVPATRTPLSLVELVRGEIDAVLVECCQLWDHAPWVLLVEESGGLFTDPDGLGIGEHGGLYSNAALHGPLLAHFGFPELPPDQRSRTQPSPST